MVKISLILSICLLVLAGCQDKPKTTATPGNPHAGVIAKEMPANVAGTKAKVTQTMNAAGYTYVEAADDKGQKTWLAMPETKVAKGDTIEYPETPPMTNFTSKTLKKTFAKILFMPGIKVLK